MSNRVSEETTELLRQLGSPEQREMQTMAVSPAYRAQVTLFAHTQYAFYVGFQLLVLALATATLCALVAFVIRLTNSVDVTGVVGILGSLVTGSASAFLQKQANAAKRRYDAAMAILEKVGAPESSA